MVEIVIDGKTLEAEPGEMIIQVADKAGITIPRFCYHKKLPIAANCRMCLVDVEKSPKPLPACATPITDGMVVRTQSQLALDAQKAVMEFLLINHPLDCPICDQGGECELQDVAVGYGSSVSRYTEGKRSVKDKDIGSLISTEMTRCIHCTRCVRFGDDVAGVRELGVTGRGETTEIGTYIEKSLVSEVSGNVIDLCPVGALTAKPSRFNARAWELQQAASVAAHDCLGSNTYIHHRRGEVMRVVPRENESINETWLSDRDRFSYQGIYADDRVTSPMIKQDGKWQQVDWRDALTFAVQGLQKVIDNAGASQVAAVASPNSTVEESFLLQKLLRGLGSNHIDHRIHQTDFADQASTAHGPGLGMAVEDIEKHDCIFLVGSDIQREQPLAALRVRKASLQGSKVLVANCYDRDFHFNVDHKLISSPSQLVNSLAGVAKALLANNGDKAYPGAEKLLAQAQASSEQQALAEALKNAEQAVLLVGCYAGQHAQASVIKSLAELIAKLSGAKIAYLTEGANSAGAHLAGAIPHRGLAGLAVTKAGLDCKQMWQSQLKAYVLLNVEPELDCVDPMAASSALEQAEFVVALSPFSAKYTEYADVILPIAPAAETSGTFVNAAGTWQSFAAAVPQSGESRPAWKVLRVLGNLFQLEGFDYTSSEQVRNEVQQAVDNMSQEQNAWYCPSSLDSKSGDGLQRIAPWAIYRGDSVQRRAEALQQSASNDPLAVRVNQQTADALSSSNGDKVNVSQNGQSLHLPLQIDNAVPNDCVLLPAGYIETAILGGIHASIRLEGSKS